MARDSINCQQWEGLREIPITPPLQNKCIYRNNGRGNGRGDDGFDSHRLPNARLYILYFKWKFKL